MTNLKISVLGNGAWGSALSQMAVEAGHEVTAWARPQDFLKNPSFAQTDQLSDLREAAVLLVVLPVRILPEILPQVLAAGISPKYILMASKGLDPETGGVLSERLESLFPTSDLCVLSGPNLAHEIHQGLAAASSLYCPDDAWPVLQGIFKQTRLRLYHCRDKMGVQIGGALKNVIAIATGICHGLKLGRNMEATVMTRGLHEMMRLGVSLGANPETFYGLSGMGDTVLTCSGPASRNFKFGMLLAQGARSVDQLIEEIGTVEGISTCQSVQKLVKNNPMDLPLCQAVYDFVFNEKEPKEVVSALLERPLKTEGVDR